MGLGQKKKLSLDLLEEETDYLITAHVKYKDMLMYNSALQQFQKLIKYGQLESLTYSERVGFLIGFKECLKTMREMRLQDKLQNNKENLEKLKSHINISFDVTASAASAKGQVQLLKLQRNNFLKTIEHIDKAIEELEK